jgi:hypothetical protein
MKSRIPEILAGLAVLIAILLPLHQKLINGYWFSWHSVWHHESVEAWFVAVAAGLLLGKYLGRL